MKKAKHLLISMIVMLLLLVLISYAPTTASASLPFGVTLTPTDTPVTPPGITVTPSATATEIISPPGETATPTVTNTPVTITDTPGAPGVTATPEPPREKQPTETAVILLPETGELPPTGDGSGLLALLGAGLAGIGIGFLLGAGRRGGLGRFFDSERRQS